MDAESETRMYHLSTSGFSSQDTVTRGLCSVPARLKETSVGGVKTAFAKDDQKAPKARSMAEKTTERILSNILVLVRCDWQPRNALDTDFVLASCCIKPDENTTSLIHSEIISVETIIDSGIKKVVVLFMALPLGTDRFNVLLGSQLSYEKTALEYN